MKMNRRDFLQKLPSLPEQTLSQTETFLSFFAAQKVKSTKRKLPKKEEEITACSSLNTFERLLIKAM